jgi:succinyl-CoA synthetase beta subunit
MHAFVARLNGKLRRIQSRKFCAILNVNTSHNANTPVIRDSRREEGQVLAGRRLANLARPDVLTERRRASRLNSPKTHCFLKTVICVTAPFTPQPARVTRALPENFATLTTMARLHEYEGKAILASNGFNIPRGGAAFTADEAVAAAKQLGGEVVIKIQAWTTGRAAIGGVAFAKRPADVRAYATRMLRMKVGQFPVEAVLVEEKIDIAREFFLSFAIDDASRSPMIIFATGGGTGIEERAASTRRIACDVSDGPADSAVAEAVSSCGLSPRSAEQLSELLGRLFVMARSIEARSLEINPLVLTKAGEFVAADCRVTIDDYAVVRHPDLGIEIAREFDHPPTQLERIAYAVEQNDHRGTFYFAQLATAASKGSKGLVGFHGAGGGGSMMSMDAIVNAGFTIANFTDTSGNPSASKVYRAARIILAQPDLVGYFGSGSGVASQEQFWSAYGLAKAFWELDLDIPAVIRLGGNTEDRAVDILARTSKLLRAPVEGYRKTDTPAFIAGRFDELVANAGGKKWKPRAPRVPKFVNDPSAMVLPVKNGRV